MNVKPATYNIVHERGTRITHSFIAKESTNGPVIDLTGTTFSGQIRKSYTDKSSLVIPISFSMPAPETGAWSFTLDDTNFDLFPAEMTDGVYDILWETLSGDKPKLLQGTVKINGTATRPT